MKIKPWIFGVLFICTIIVYFIIFFVTACLAIEFLQPIWAYFTAFVFGMITVAIIAGLVEEKKEEKKNEKP